MLVDFLLLCGDCEQKFGNAEKSASVIFKKVLNDEEQFAYDAQFTYFAISILWRLLKTDVLEKEKDCTSYDLLVKAEEEWRNYLLNGVEPSTFNKIHLMTGVDPLREEDLIKHDITVPEKFIQYMGRMTDGGLADAEKTTKCMMYFKLPRMFFIAPITGFDESLYGNSTINPQGGIFEVGNVSIQDEDIAPFLMSRATLVQDQYLAMSEAQRNKMREKTEEKWDEIQNKDLGDILRYNNERYRKG